jgi:hypothetical protein
VTRDLFDVFLVPYFWLPLRWAALPTDCRPNPDGLVRIAVVENLLPIDYCFFPVKKGARDLFVAFERLIRGKLKMPTVTKRHQQPSVTLAVGVCLLLAALLPAGCASDGDELNGNITAKPKATASDPTADSPPKSQEGILKTDPNPVPPGPGIGKTTISWATKGELGIVKLYVSQDGMPEKEVARASAASVEIPWIVTGRTYDFFLYGEANGNRRLIDRIRVTRPVD